MYQVTVENNGIEETISTSNNSSKKILSGSINRELNAIDRFTFALSIHNKAWASIKPLISIIRVKNKVTGKNEFTGRVLEPSREMTSDGKFFKTLTCEGELSYLNDSVQRHGEYRNITPKEFFKIMIDAHNKQVTPDKRFELGVVDVTNSTDNVYRYLTYENTFKSIMDKLVGRLGGYISIRYENGKRYLDYLKSSGKQSEMPIKLAQNMKSIKEEVKPSELITRLIPLGESLESKDENATDASQARLDIKSVNNGKDYIDDEALIKEFGIIEGTQIWDDVTKPSNLKTKGDDFLKNQRIVKQIDVTALNLALINLKYEDFSLGNYFKTDNAVLNISDNFQLFAQQINLFDVASSSLTFGEKKITLSQYQAQNNKDKKQILEYGQKIKNQQKELSKVKTQLSETEKKIEETKQEVVVLGDAVNSSKLEFETAVANINKMLDEIGESLPSDETMGELIQSMNDFKTFEKNQLLINTATINKLDEQEKRIKALEDKGGSN
ncbi:phage tail spike protein [Vagococcus carniphilus]|uniref:phage tail spike protein n=1 Tax=Vagococcus carniphilus TaxID=218144 RepID=UPI0028918E3D|nr:phage tail spike protein [Vagococcus carniphilus]MDT2815981.1 phage tail spike protein [Vagococcus carniphilus]